jgi:hypothetical protein
MIRSSWIFVWEQWRQTSRAVGLMALAIGVYALLLWLVDDLLRWAFADNQVLAFGTAFLPVAGAMALMFLNESRNHIGFAFPKRMLVLPVHTSVLVGSQLVFKIAVTALLSALAGYACTSLIRETFFVWPQMTMSVVIVIMLQALVFLLCGYGTGTGLVLFAIAVAVSLPLVEPAFETIQKNFIFGNRDAAIIRYPTFSPWALPSALATAAWWCALAYLGARRARREVAEDSVGRLTAFATHITHLEGAAKEFASPEAAQRWLEWRRGGFLFPWLSLAAGVALMMLFSASMGSIESRFIVSFSLLVVGPVVMACLLGYMFTRSDQRYQWFVGPRPLTTPALVRSHLYTGARAIVSAYCLIILFLIIANNTIHSGQGILASLVVDAKVITSTQGSDVNGHVMVAGFALLTLVAVWSMMWLGRAAGVIAWLGGMAAIATFLIDGNLYNLAGASTRGLPVTVFAVCTTTLALLAIVWASVRAYRRGLLSIRAIALCAVCWVLLGASTLALSDIISAADRPIAILCMAIPLAPLATLPVTVDWHRHG